MRTQDVADSCAVRGKDLPMKCGIDLATNQRFQSDCFYANCSTSRATAIVASNEGRTGVNDPGIAKRAVRRHSCLPASDLLRRSAWSSLSQPVIPHHRKSLWWQNRTLSVSNRPTRASTTDPIASAAIGPALNSAAMHAGDTPC